MIRWFRQWRERRAAWKRFKAMKDGDPEKYLAAVALVHGTRAADAIRAARQFGGAS